MSWKDALIITLSRIGLMPRYILDRAFIKLRDKYLKIEEHRIKLLEENTKLIKIIKKLKGEPDPEDDPPPSTPSSQIPTYKKENKGKKRRKKNGQKKGHKGQTRGACADITHEEDALPKDGCNYCGGDCGKPYLLRERVIEDIEEVKIKRRKVSIFASRCKKCGKIHEGVVEEALKNNQIGNTILIWSIYLHFFIGTSTRKVTDICSRMLSFKLSEGCLIQNWHRIADVLEISYDKLKPYLEKGGHAHSDETGWRLLGTSWWAWIFTNNLCCVYFIDKHRSSKVAFQFLGEFFNGILISDFYSAYGLIDSIAKQKCFAHLFTELKKCKQKDDSNSLEIFCKLLKRFLRDALKLKLEYKEEKITKTEFKSRRMKLEKRLDKIIIEPQGNQNKNVKRLRKRLRKHRNELLTFLYYNGIDATNNLGERRIRLIALMRKISFGSFSQKGAKTRYILMSLIQTCKILNVDFIDYVRFALNEHLYKREIPGIHEYIELMKMPEAIAA